MFRERDKILQQNERSPLIEHPVIFSRSQEFPMDPYRMRRVRKKQKFQWLLFFGVTLISLFLLILLIATMIRLADEELHLPDTSTTAVPQMVVTTEASSTTSMSTSTMSSTTTSTTTAKEILTNETEPAT